MSNLAVSATTTPYAVARSTTGSSSSTTVSSTSSATPKTVTSSTTPSSSTTANQTVSVATSSNTATLSSSTTYAYGSSASNSISRMVSSSTTPNVTSSSTTPQVSSSSTTLPYGTLERNGGVITILTSSSTMPSVASSSTTPQVSSSSTTLPYGTLERNGGVITILTSSSTTPSMTSSSTTPPVSSSSTTLPYGTLERNGGVITILTSSSTTPSMTSSSTTPPVSSSSTTLPPGTLERNGGYITILTSSSTTPNISSGDTTLSTGATTTPPAPGFDVNKIDYSYSSMIEEIDNQIRALAYDSALKHEDPDGAKAKLAELQAMRQQIYQEASIRNSIFFGVTENIEYEEFSFTRKEEKAFDLMVQENIMEFISAEKYSNDAWKNYNEEEKKMHLTEIYNYACEQLGISIDGIEFDGQGEAYGAYDGIKNVIVIKESCLGEWADNGSGLIKTLIHEVRHAYQTSAISNPELYVVSKETREAWAENYVKENYIEGKNGAPYRAQPLEWDAANFAKQVKNIEEAKKVTRSYEGSWEIE